MSRLILLLSLAVFLAPCNAHAQDRLADRSAFYLGANVLLGGGAAVMHALLSPADPPPLKAFLKGALGGAVMFGGQRMVGSGRGDLRLAGVQAVAIGASMTRNAGAGLPLLSELTFPLYPLYLHVRAGAERERRFSVRISAGGAASLAWALARDRKAYGVSFDWKQTLLAGGPVFRSQASVIYAERGLLAGSHRLGTTWYTTGGRRPDQIRAILAHETIHLTQFTRDAILFGVPLGDAALAALGTRISRVGGLIALDLFLPMALLNEGLSMALPSVSEERRWIFYELEARALSGTR